MAVCAEFRNCLAAGFWLGIALFLVSTPRSTLAQDDRENLLSRYQQTVKSAERCTACNNPDVLEISWLWDLERQMLEKVGRLVAT